MYIQLNETCTRDQKGNGYSLMKHRILLIVCLLFLFTATACVLESPDDSSLVSVTEDIVSESEEAPETEIEETGDMQNASSPVAKEGGAVLIYNGEIAAEGCPEALETVAERMGLEVLYFDSADTLFEQLDDAALCMIGGTEDDLDPLVSQFTPEMQVELQSWIESGGGFLGICGGAYIGSMGWEESDGFVAMLNLAPVETEEYLSDPDPRIISVDWNDVQRSIYYAYGPAFLTDGVPAVEVITTYEDGRTAAIEYARGDGNVILCGPHPEADETWLDDAPVPLDADQWEGTFDLIQELFERLS